MCVWICSGDPNCFLFTMFPSVGVYQSTSYNQNYMYLQQNAQTLSNGLVSEASMWTQGDGEGCTSLGWVGGGGGVELL